MGRSLTSRRHLSGLSERVLPTYTLTAPPAVLHLWWLIRSHDPLREGLSVKLHAATRVEDYSYQDKLTSGPPFKRLRNATSLELD